MSLGSVPGRVATGLGNVPQYTMQHLDMWVGFAVGDYALNMLGQIVPRTGGMGGMLINSLAAGALKTADFGIFKVFDQGAAKT